MFSVIYFSETSATDNLICNDSNFQIENYAILHQVREFGRGLSIVAYKEIFFKPQTDLFINSNDAESLCFEIHHKKNKII